MEKEMHTDETYKLYREYLFEPLHKLFEIDTYVPPQEFLNVCSKYISATNHEKAYTLEQAACMIYTECHKKQFTNYDPIIKIEYLVSQGHSYARAQTEAFKHYEIEETVKYFTEKLKRGINNVFGVLFGEGTSIELCKINKSGDVEDSCVIYEDELQFYGYIMLHYKKGNYLNFTKKDFKKVAPDYLKVMLLGARLVLGHHHLDLTSDMLHVWLNIKMECYRQIILEKYVLLHDRINDIFVFQANETGCVIDALEEIQKCEFLLNNLTEEIDEHIDAIDSLKVTNRNLPKDVLKFSKRKIRESRIDSLD